MGRKRGEQRREIDVVRERSRISELYMRMVPIHEIAKIMEMSVTTVSKDLAAIQEIWMEKAADDLQRIKARELAKIDILEMEYWKGWDRSQKLWKKIKIEDVIGEDTVVGVKQTVEKMKPVGDTKFLEGVERCIKMRGDIIGMWAPKLSKVEGGFVLLNIGIDAEDL